MTFVYSLYMAPLTTGQEYFVVEFVLFTNKLTTAHKHQHLFCTFYYDPSRLSEFISHSDTREEALFVHECLIC